MTLLDKNKYYIYKYKQIHTTIDHVKYQVLYCIKHKMLYYQVLNYINFQTNNDQINQLKQSNAERTRKLLLAMQLQVIGDFRLQ